MARRDVAGEAAESTLSSTMSTDERGLLDKFSLQKKGDVEDYDCDTYSA